VAKVQPLKPAAVRDLFKQNKGSTKSAATHKAIILGDHNVGKTCLWLRYMYYDQTKGINIEQTPN